MKRLLSLMLCVVLIALYLCGCHNVSSVYMAVTQIDHCAVEPDDKLNMSKKDERCYRRLMENMLDYKSSIRLSKDADKNEYYIDLLKQSPYFFFVKDYTLSKNSIEITYAYSKQEQKEMQSFIDNTFLDIVNTNYNRNDNTLDKILNVYSAVASLITYDHDRTDNKQLDSLLFKYPSDEIYKAFKSGKSLCFGFAYTLRFALLQLDIDCFCVYGPCSAHNQGHMWNIFKYDGNFYTCDSAWDRSDEGYPQLFNFGKTDQERKADTLTRTGFSSTFFDTYGDIKCTDETFKIFRGIDQYYYDKEHIFSMVDYKGNRYSFDTKSLKLTKLSTD